MFIYMKRPVLIQILIPLCLSCTVKDAEICKFKDGREASVSLTFDDGIVDHYTLVYPKLNYSALKGTFWICGSNIGIDDSYTPRLTWDMCREMAADGHEISNHSWSHKNFAKISEEEIREEVQKNDKIIERELGRKPITFCYPFNAITETAAEIASEGRVALRTYQEAMGQRNSHSTPESLDAWLRKVIDNGEWGVTMMHGIHNGWDQWDDETVLWDFFKRLGLKRDSVWVDTFAKVASYMAERDNCSIKVRKAGNKVTLIPDCSLDSALYKEPLTARVLGRYLEFDPFGGAQTYDFSDPLLGKVVNVIGDSYVKNHVRPYTETWHYKVAKKHHMVYNNYGINGASIAFDRESEGFGKALVDRYDLMSDEADYVIIIAGHNDAGMITYMPDSTQVFLDRLDNLCSGIKAKYPNAGIGFVTPWNVDRENFPEVTQAIRAACDKYGFKLLDATESIIDVRDKDFRAKYFQGPNDTAHLTAEGHDLLLDWGEDFFKSLAEK